MPDSYWNKNVHYQRVVLDAVPVDCGEGLDVGCGDGSLVRKLAAKARTVTGVDRSIEMIRCAREGSAGVENVTFIEADYLDESSLPGERYDFVSAVAVVHHATFEDAVRGLVRLLAPGGRLVIIGIARNRTWLDWTIAGFALPASRFFQWRGGGDLGGDAIPVRDAVMDWSDVSRAARTQLPGCRYRRLVWRYSVIWDKPVNTFQ